MNKYVFCKLRKFLSIILTFSLVITSIPARSFNGSYLATPGITEVLNSSEKFLTPPVDTNRQKRPENKQASLRHWLKFNTAKTLAPIVAIFSLIIRAIGTHIPTAMLIILAEIIIVFGYCGGCYYLGYRIGEYSILEELRLVETAQKVERNLIDVWPGRYAIGGPERARYLSTHSLNNCLGLILYDKDSKLGIVAHCYDMKTDIPNSLNSMVKNLIDLGANQDTLEARIIGGKEKWSKRRIKKLRRELQKRNITITYEELTGGKYREFTFDTYTGKIGKYRSIFDKIAQKPSIKDNKSKKQTIPSSQPTLKSN